LVYNENTKDCLRLDIGWSRAKQKKEARRVRARACVCVLCCAVVVRHVCDKYPGVL